MTEELAQNVAAAPIETAQSLRAEVKDPARVSTAVAVVVSEETNIAATTSKQPEFQLFLKNLGGLDFAEQILQGKQKIKMLDLKNIDAICMNNMQGLNLVKFKHFFEKNSYDYLKIRMNAKNKFNF